MSLHFAVLWRNFIWSKSQIFNEQLVIFFWNIIFHRNMNKQNKSIILEKKSSSPLAQRLNSPVGRKNTSGFIKSEQYYLEKLKTQREKIEMLINEFGKMADALDLRDQEIARLKELREKSEDQKVVLEKVQVDAKKETQASKEENERLREEVRRLREDGEKEKLKAEINCLEEKANFFESWYQNLSAANLQLKQEKDHLAKELENKRQDHEAQLQELKERTNSMLSELQETSKISGVEVSNLKDTLCQKQSEISKLNEEVRQLNAQFRGQSIKQENEIKQLAHTLQLKEKQQQFKLESLQQDIKQARETLERREQQLHRAKSQSHQKKVELEKATQKLEEMELKTKAVLADMDQLKQNMASTEEVEYLKARVAELEAKCQDYEDYLQLLRDENLEEEKMRREFEMKRNQEVERIEKIFTRIRAKGIDLPTLTE